MRVAAKSTRPGWAMRIETLRERLGINQSEFARKLGVSAMAVSRWERGINEPPAHTYIQLGKLAGNGGDGWFFWERAGISKADARRMLQRR